MNNYHGIDVSSLFGKILDQVLLLFTEDCMDEAQDPLQFGFTRGVSPYFASLVMSETIAENNDLGRCTFISSLDVKKAFDVVHHPTLFDKLFRLNFDPHLLRYCFESLSNMQTAIKWDGFVSDTFDVSQGTRQGGVPSCHFYKHFVNPLLSWLRRSGYGAYIGPTYVGNPTVADDLALLSDNSIDNQIMLDIVNTYSRVNKYIVHTDEKSSTTIFAKKPVVPLSRPNFGGKLLPLTSSFEHLCIVRDSTTCSNLTLVNKRISTLRRASYLVLGNVLTFRTQLHPKISLNVFSTYIIPATLSGLESLVLTPNEIDLLSSAHYNIVRRLLYLPKFVLKSAVYLISGTLPLPYYLDCRILKLFSMVVSERTQF